MQTGHMLDIISGILEKFLDEVRPEIFPAMVQRIPDFFIRVPMQIEII
jgi:hypothetical protein